MRSGEKSVFTWNIHQFIHVLLDRHFNMHFMSDLHSVYNLFIPTLVLEYCLNTTTLSLDILLNFAVFFMQSSNFIKAKAYARLAIQTRAA
ncbi:hypothetical protein TUMEXPCC7403_10185 [Tumidithrix helvetica PCC 7403]